ncbi:MAG: glycosyltransferase [Termitinemataceae bacterium]|nr:MAG: glycosyltransferase [Termitinemataceae bacterium]
MIPKIIHYCWFGGNQLPELALNCIASWKKYFPDFEIKEWNESNYNVHKIAYTSEAYNAKKYAFVSDYARFDILYQYGGIYFDTDVEVIKSFDDILQNGGFMGLESVGKVAAGLGIGCNAGLGICYQVLEFYATLHFLNKDSSYNLKTIVEYVSEILIKNGLKKENAIQVLNGVIVYPIEYFAPKSFITGKLEITKNTYSIHHYHDSWASPNQKKYDDQRIKYIHIFGEKMGTILSYPYFLLYELKDYGLRMFFKKICKNLFRNRNT